MRVASPVVQLVVLLRSLTDAEALAGVLDSLLTDGSAATVVPPVRGAAFFRTQAGVPGAAACVYLVVDEPGLEDATTGAPGRFIVAVHDNAPRPRSWHTVLSEPGGELLDLAFGAVDQLAGAGSIFPMSAVAIVDSARRARGGEVAPAPGRRRPPHALLEEFDAGLTPVVDPFDAAIAASSARRVAVAPIAAPPPAPSRAYALASTWRRLRMRYADDRALAATLVARAPMIVVVGSRKGGVGKTSHAAGIAIASGEALDRAGRRAAIVDANIANPDAWGHLAIPPQAATVRQLATALAAGRPAPRPVNASTPALACYPETRDGVEYTRSDIRRIATHLRSRYAFVVVDMSNRLPDVTAGPEAAVAAFWLDEADALVLPTATARNDFTAVLDYLDVGDMPPVVVPCIVPSNRRTRNHPAVRQYRDEIASRGATIVDVPDAADSVRLAGLESVAVRDVSSAMRSAYRALCSAVAVLPPRAR